MLLGQYVLATSILSCYIDIVSSATLRNRGIPVLPGHPLHEKAFEWQSHLQLTLSRPPVRWSGLHGITPVDGLLVFQIQATREEPIAGGLWKSAHFCRLVSHLLEMKDPVKQIKGIQWGVKERWYHPFSSSSSFLLYQLFRYQLSSTLSTTLNYKLQHSRIKVNEKD